MGKETIANESFVRYGQGEFAGALEAFQQAQTDVGGDNEPFEQTFHSLALCGEAFALLRLGQTDAAVGILARAPPPDRSVGSAWRLPQALALRALGDAFDAQGQNESAMQAWSRVAELTQWRRALASDQPTWVVSHVQFRSAASVTTAACLEAVRQ